MERLSGEVEAVEPLLAEAMQLRAVCLGVDHPETIATRETLATLYKAARRYDRSHNLFEALTS